MTNSIKFKIQNGLRVSNIDVIDNSGNFVGGLVNNINIVKPSLPSTLNIGNDISITLPKSLSFPIDDGANGYVLSTDGSGNLQWIIQGAASAIRYDIDNQNLSDSEKQNARTNLGLSTIASTGDYNDLINKPTIFPGDYNDLINKPSLFSGDYNDLTNKPTIFTGDYMLDGGGPNSVYGGMPTFDFGGINV